MYVCMARVAPMKRQRAELGERKRNYFRRILKSNSIKILFITSISFFILLDVMSKNLINYYNNGKKYIIENPIYHHDLKKNLFKRIIINLKNIK